jgi:rubrerythrin
MQCRNCGRKFNEKAYARHVKRCGKEKKVKVKSAAQKRIEAMAELNPGVSTRELKKKAREEKRRKPAKKNAARGGKGSSWRHQSGALREAMRAAREHTKAAKSGKPLGPSVASPDQHAGFIRCPTCGRTFNEKAAERHIPKCASIKNKPKMLMRGSGRSATTAAKGKKGSRSCR